MERLVNNRLLYVLEKNNIICPYQSGFRKNRCTYDNLTRLEHDIQRAFEYRSSVLAVFLDIKKAYDMSWRRGIIRSSYVSAHFHFGPRSPPSNQVEDGKNMLRSWETAIMTSQHNATNSVCCSSNR